MFITFLHLFFFSLFLFLFFFFPCYYILKSNNDKSKTNSLNITNLLFAFAITDMLRREPTNGEAVYIVLFPVRDTHEDARRGAESCYELITALEATSSWQDEIGPIFENFKKKHAHLGELAYTVMYY